MVAAVPQLDGFQAGEQAALLLVQQTVEQHNGGLEFMGRRGGAESVVCRVRISSRACRLSEEVYRKRPATSERRKRPPRTRSWRGSWTSAWSASASSSAKQPRGDCSTKDSMVATSVRDRRTRPHRGTTGRHRRSGRFHEGHNSARGEYSWRDS